MFLANQIVTCSIAALFAVGLVVYLQDINRQVATPVFAITAAFAILYVAATALPATFESCPYGTVLSTPLRVYVVPPTKWVLAALTFLVCCLLFLFGTALGLFLMCIRLHDLSERVGKVLIASGNGLKPLAVILGFKDPVCGGKSNGEEIPMDIVTSRILAWLILNSEDTSHVGVALRAISGASIELPMHPLLKLDVQELVSGRLVRCLSGNGQNGELSLRPNSSFELASSYFRALSHLLVSDSSFDCETDKWGGHNNIGLSVPPDRLIGIYRLWVLIDYSSLRTMTNNTCCHENLVLQIIV